MQLISLNVAGGKWLEPLLSFVKDKSETTDIFCFQELFFDDKPEFTNEFHCRVNVYNEIKNILPGFNSEIRYAPKYAKYFMQELLPEDVRPGVAIFYKKGLKKKASGGFLTYKPKSTPGVDFGALLTGNLQWLKLKSGNNDFLITQIHGLYQRDTNKINTPAREYQSKKILNLLNRNTREKIIMR